MLNFFAASAAAVESSILKVPDMLPVFPLCLLHFLPIRFTKFKDRSSLSRRNAMCWRVSQFRSNM